MFFLKPSTHKDLEPIVNAMQMDISNNYKDNARDDFNKLVEKYEELSSIGKLNDKQKAHYSNIISIHKEKYGDYTHHLQKTRW